MRKEIANHIYQIVRESLKSKSKIVSRSELLERTSVRTSHQKRRLARVAVFVGQLPTSFILSALYIQIRHFALSY